MPSRNERPLTVVSFSKPEMTVADESIIDRAIGLIPGVGTPKRRKAASPRAQLALLQRNLAKLVKDIDQLSRLIAKSPAAKTAKRATTAKQSASGRKARNYRSRV